MFAFIRDRIKGDGKQYSLIKGLSAAIEILLVYNDNYMCISGLYHVGKTHS
jgi:hypothetical protein